MKSYNDVLQAMKGADVWSWHRDTQWLSIYADDYAADRRTVYNVRLKDDNCEVVTICEYNAKEHCWRGNPQRVSPTDLTGHGKKALIEYIRGAAIAECGLPNPQFVHSYRKEVL